MLTKAAASVLADLEGTQQHWQGLQHLPGSYAATTSDGRLLSLNILNGIILLDGRPPSRLLREIRDHPLYQRTFGDVNFEVSDLTLV